MTIEERVELAATLKQQHGTNCCQAVLIALQDQMKFTEDELRVLGAGFGLGLGNMEGTCGALIGAAIALGLNTNGDKAAVRALNEEFKQKCGAITCEDIKGRFTGKITCSCEDCCRNAVRAYEDVLNKI